MVRKSKLREPVFESCGSVAVSTLRQVHSFYCCCTWPHMQVDLCVW